MRIYRTKGLTRFARRENVSDRSLRDAIDRAERGLIDADLGDGLIKQRVARRGQGRSSGYRMVIAYRTRDRAVFLFGFAKNARDNVSPDELASIRVIADYWLRADSTLIEQATLGGELQEVL